MGGGQEEDGRVGGRLRIHCVMMKGDGRCCSGNGDDGCGSDGDDGDNDDDSDSDDENEK